MQRLAIFASGSGTNADRIMSYFENHDEVEVALVISDKADPGVKNFAQQHNVDFKHLTYASMNDQAAVLSLLEAYKINFLILAGYMRLIPDYLVEEFRDKIINIHPALLPKFGGKGMYGMNVHKEVKRSGAAETGITIHLVNEKYDEGRILFQATTHISKTDSPEEIAQKVHTLEHKYFPKVIHSWILDHTSS